MNSMLKRGISISISEGFVGDICKPSNPEDEGRANTKRSMEERDRLFLFAKMISNVGVM